jgi:uncharacterized glyoxalase superfamily protein PhnB
MLRRAIPVLHVSRSTLAETFYCSQLGFTQRFAYRPDPARVDPCYMGLSRDGVTIHLSSFPEDGVVGGVVNLLVDDLDALHEELFAKGVAIALPPTDQEWGNREMYLTDPDGNSIRFVRDDG